MIGRNGMSFAEREKAGLGRSEGIGLWCVNRGKDSCRWRTEACKDCYNRRLSRVYPATANAWEAEGSDNVRWNSVTADAFKGLARVRLCTRGEPFSTVEDIYRIREWLTRNPSTKFWIPTRAWTTGIRHGWNYTMVEHIQREILPLGNARVMASVDPFTAQMLPKLQAEEWSTLYFESYAIPEGFTSEVHPGSDFGNVVKCPKTWTVKKDPKTGRLAGLHGHCQTCNICFGTERVDVWLRNHSSAYSLENIKRCK